jgi:hypothetical protein
MYFFSQIHHLKMAGEVILHLHTKVKHVEAGIFVKNAECESKIG